MADTLENMTLPPNARNVEFLRAFPKLRRLSYKFDATVRGPSETVEQFWATYDRAKSAAAP